MRSYWMSRLLVFSLFGAGVAQALPEEDGPEQMEELIRFLADRIATEDPTLSPELRQQALLDSLELMGVAVPEPLTRTPDLSPAEMAHQLLMGPPEDPPAPPPSQVGIPVLPPSPGPQLRSRVPVERRLAIQEVLETFPVPEEFRRDPARAMPPIAQMARVLIANPGKSSPWSPQPLPTGEERVRLEQARVERERLGSGRGYEGSAQSYKDRLERLRSKGIPLSSANPRELDQAESVHPGLLAAAAATIRSIPSPSPEKIERLQAASRESTGAMDLPRVVVPAGARIHVRMGDQILDFQEGSHELLWEAEVEVAEGERILLVYPREGTIFRLGRGSRSRIEDSGVRRLDGEVVKFLSKPGDNLQVLSS